MAPVFVHPAEARRRRPRRLAPRRAAVAALLAFGLAASCNALWGVDELRYRSAKGTGHGGDAGAAGAGGAGGEGLAAPEPCSLPDCAQCVQASCVLGWCQARMAACGNNTACNAMNDCMSG
ncbi:MAG: hypothetical protein HY744_13165 [Deltaproteobacteria bacterium]|nr:hypothetical protein [Deltaproteobacteria bacterium]